MVFGNSTQAFKGQKYSEIKKSLETSGSLFEDPEFPATDKSLFFTEAKLANIVWKRPKEVCEQPQLFVEGVNQNDVTQGSVGNCWFVAACAALATNKDVWKKVIPDSKDQEWNASKPENYCGIFRFCFWRFGQWYEVVVDDRLPTLNDQLIYTHSRTRNEFWSALLEKAYAKLIGNYELLDGGDLAEALEDFTGGCNEAVDLEKGGYEIAEKRAELFSMMKDAIKHRALMAAAIPAKSSEQMENVTEMGLVQGHAYGVTAVKTISKESSSRLSVFSRADKIDMVRLRNPWGEVEWKGAFSDQSEEWKNVPESEKKKLGLTLDNDDGEFWMTHEDFCHQFQQMAVCQVVNTSLFSLEKKWQEELMYGAWTLPSRAGGCPNNRDTFLHNPQYMFTVSEEEEVMASLMQDPKRDSPDMQRLYIGFSLFRVELNRAYRVHQKPHHIASSPYKNARSQMLRLTLPRGRYLLIPATFDPGCAGSYMLRLYTSSNPHAKELVKGCPQPSALEACCCCRGRPRAVTRVTVVRAAGLERQEMGGADPYCIISCGREKVRTPHVSDTLNPEWNAAAIFYRSKPDSQPIKIQVWNHNVIRDEFMGETTLLARDKTGGPKSTECTLHGRGKKATKSHPGRLTVMVETHGDPVAL